MHYDRTMIRAIIGLERPPDGTPGLRDVDHPCSFYDPGHEARGRYWGGVAAPDTPGECWGDGHYLCKESCVHLVGHHD